MFAIGLSLLAVACNSDSQGDPNTLAKGKLTIEGELKGMDSGYVEFLFPVADSSFTDSVEVKDGKFTFSTDIPEPVNMLMRVSGTRGEELSFFADPGKMTIKGSRDSVYASVVTGGKTQVAYKAGEDSLRAIMGGGEALYMQYMQAQSKQDMAEMQRIENEFNNLQKRAIDFAKAHAIKNRSNVVAAYYSLMYMNEPGKEEELQKMYDTLSPAVQKSYFGGKLNEIVQAAAKTAVGQVAPEFSQNDPNGQPVNLSSFRGKYLLIDFWAAWCQPCRAENPNVVKAYNTYKDKGFEILGVSLDQDKDAWLKAVADDKLTWTQVSDLKYWNNDVAKLYGVRSIPASYLLDKEGKIVAKNLRGEELEAKLKELMP